MKGHALGILNNCKNSVNFAGDDLKSWKYINGYGI
jgi:hypothetical protein